MIENWGWSVLVQGRRRAWVWPEAYNTRREARASFFSWWADEKTAKQKLKSGEFSIVKVRIEVMQ